MRQTLTENALGILDLEANGFAPRPTYFLYLVWKRVMGQRMLRAAASLPSPSGTATLRAYAACHPRGNGDVSMLLLNCGNSTQQVSLPQVAARREEWVLTAKGGDVSANAMELNGAVLSTDSGGNPPHLNGVTHSNHAQPFRLPPQALAFVVLLEAKASACM